MVATASCARATRHGAGRATAELVALPAPGAGSRLTSPARRAVDGDAGFALNDTKAAVAAPSSGARVSGAASLSGASTTLALMHRGASEAVGAGPGRGNGRGTAVLSFRSAG